MAPDVLDELARLGVTHATPLHAMRSSLAPLATALAEQLGSPWRTIDLDDDEASLSAASGWGEQASAVDRLLATFVPLFNGACVAAPLEAASLQARLGLEMSVVRNSVALPEVHRHPPEDPPLLLFVGNLTYHPNVYAATYLAQDVLPLVGAALRRPVNLAMVGPYDASLAAVARLPGVQMTGYVEDLGEPYRRASVMVAPLFHGAGTSIKLLEAFARGIPVVTTRTGTRGLAVRDGTHVLLGENPRELAAHTVRVLRDPELGRRLALEARSFVEEHHGPAMAEADIHAFLLAASRATKARVE
jgi:glycosyltransferase involved in cell wall biosynthesis